MPLWNVTVAPAATLPSSLQASRRWRSAKLTVVADIAVQVQRAAAGRDRAGPGCAALARLALIVPKPDQRRITAR